MVTLWFLILVLQCDIGFRDQGGKKKEKWWIIGFAITGDRRLALLSITEDIHRQKYEPVSLLVELIHSLH